MCAIIRYNQKRIIWHIENFKNHTISIGDISGAWNGNILDVDTANTQPAKNYFSIIYQW